MKVNFLIIGAAKSATTSLSYALSEHPDICFSTPKEPQFFSKPNWQNEIEDYHALFTSKAKLYGEGSTNYTKWPSYNQEIHRDIYEYNSDMKLIYIMRHPIDRIISHYIHAYNRGYEKSRDINEAIQSNPHYINVSKYAMQLAPYRALFDDQQMLLLFFEDFIAQPQQTLDNVFDFLNLRSVTVSKHVLNSNKSFDRKVLHYKYDNPKTILDKLKKIGLVIKNQFNTNFISSKPELSRDTKAYLIEMLKDDVSKIEALTGRDLSNWLTA